MFGRLVQILRRRIALKLTLTLVGFVAVTMLVAGLYLSRALEALAVESLEARLATAGRLLHDDARALVVGGADAGGTRGFVTRTANATDSRVTLILADGRVVGDSGVAPEDLPRMENHAGRPEVQAALAGRLGRDLRTSATINAPLLYVALPLQEAGRVVGVLRLALPLSAVTASYGDLHRVLLAGGLVALAVALGIGIFVAGRVTRPVVEMQAIAQQMSEGNFAVRASARSVDEIGTLGRALNLLATRLRQQIHDLEQERAKATAILDGMVEGVIAVDGRDSVLLMNERARSLFGLGVSDVVGKPFLEVIRNADLHQIFRDTRAGPEGPRALARESGAQREVALTMRVERIVQVNAVPLRFDSNDVGVVMVLHDVTALRRLERVRTEFVANVSHELRTPLTAIRGYLETLLGGALEEPENARNFLEIVVRHSERLGRLLDDLTDLSNIELGRIRLRLEPTRLHEVVASVLGIIWPRAEKGEVTLVDAVPADLPPVVADHDRLVQILINLVDNAVKYTSPGGTVTMEARSAGEGRVEVAVRDTGMGIPPQDLPRVTERFYRVDKARSRELGGTGLGLAIVKHLVIAHGGELWIESEPGRGTTVRFTLPVPQAAGGGV
jgi:two-component system, OmpR family, phosphate regulon sensor histidine kinase PhoR